MACNKLGFKQIYIDLPSGHKMPIVGLGTYQSKTEEVKAAVEAALDAGYKLIDTAYFYQNEGEIGDVIKARIDSRKLKREDIFVTTKLSGRYMGSREAVRKGFMKSLTALKLSYIDLYLIHSPIGMEDTPESPDMHPKGPHGKYLLVNHDLVETWKAMEELVKEGLIKSIGLSNFNSKQIARIQAATQIPISNLQVECHALLQQTKLFQFCKARKITMTSYSTFAVSLPGMPNLMTNPVVTEIATHHERSPSQILLRHMIQRGIAVIPKSVTPSRVQENIQVFDFKLSDAEMTKLNQLDQNKRLWDDVFRSFGGEHPEFPFNEDF